MKMILIIGADRDMKETGFYVMESKAGARACLDAACHMVYVMRSDGTSKPFRHTENETKVLEMIVCGNGAVVSYELFFEKIFSKEAYAETNLLKSLQNAVSALNKELKGFIVNDSGTGYKLNGTAKSYHGVPYEFLFGGDEEELRKEYKKSLLEYSDENLTMRLLGGGQPVADSYVQPRLSVGVQKLKSILSPLYDRSYNLGEKAEHKQFVRCVQAPSGVGKTSLLQSVVAAVIDDGAQRLRENMPSYCTDYLPVFIRCSDANTLLELTSLTDLALCSDLMSRERFKALLKSADDLLLLVDGIDELYELDRFMKLFREFIKQYPAADVIVTSRFNILQSEHFEQVTLSEFTDADICAYMNNAEELNPALGTRTRALKEAMGMSGSQDEPLSLSAEVFRVLSRSPYILNRLVYDRGLELSVPSVLGRICNEIIDRRWIKDKFSDENYLPLFNRDDVKLSLGAAAFDRIFITQNADGPISQDMLESFFDAAAHSGLSSCKKENQYEAMVNFAHTMSVRTGLICRDENGDYSFTNPYFELYLAAYYIKALIVNTVIPAIDMNKSAMAVVDKRIDPFACLVQLLPDDEPLTGDMLYCLSLLVYDGDIQRIQKKSIVLYLLFRAFVCDKDERDAILLWVDRTLDNVFGSVNIADKKKLRSIANTLERTENADE